MAKAPMLRQEKTPVSSGTPDLIVLQWLAELAGAEANS